MEEERASRKEASVPSKGKSAGDREENEVVHIARP